MGQVTTGATTHYPNLLPAALMNAGYAVGANVPGSLAGTTGTSTASGYVLRMSNLPDGSAKHDIVKVQITGMHAHLCGVLCCYSVVATGVRI
jgi:hypothetical protein